MPGWDILVYGLAWWLLPWPLALLVTVVVLVYSLS